MAASDAIGTVRSQSGGGLPRRVLRNNPLADDLRCLAFVRVVPDGQHCLERVSAVSDYVQLALLRLAERRNAAVPEEQDQLGGAGGVADLDSHVAGDPEASLQVRVCLLGGFEEKSRGHQAVIDGAPGAIRCQRAAALLLPAGDHAGSGVARILQREAARI